MLVEHSFTAAIDILAFEAHLPLPLSWCQAPAPTILLLAFV